VRKDDADRIILPLSDQEQLYRVIFAGCVVNAMIDKNGTCNLTAFYRAWDFADEMLRIGRSRDEQKREYQEEAD
jgi:predicted adenine nucleotide alpha hydrolase (AANH) superfamily ATPase